MLGVAAMSSPRASKVQAWLSYDGFDDWLP
jgi:hypothetical protein